MRKIRELKNKILCYGDGIATIKVRFGDHLGVRRYLRDNFDQLRQGYDHRMASLPDILYILTMKWFLSPSNHHNNYVLIVFNIIRCKV